MTTENRPALLLLALALATAPAHAEEERPRIDPVRTTTPPAIDGVLDDVAWQGGPLPLTEWLTYNPLNGDKIAQR